MAQTKRDVASSVSNQQALVKRLLGSHRPQPTKTIIPGGKFLLDEVDQRKLESAVFTWLRRHRYFEYVRISFARDPGAMQLNIQKIQDFPVDEQYSIWEQPAHGKRWLAEQIADVLARQKIVYIEAKKDGLYVATEKEESEFGPASEEWEPYTEILPIRRGEYKPIFPSIGT